MPIFYKISIFSTKGSGSPDRPCSGGGPKMGFPRVNFWAPFKNLFFITQWMQNGLWISLNQICRYGHFWCINLPDYKDPLQARKTHFRKTNYRAREEKIKKNENIFFWNQKNRNMKIEKIGEDEKRIFKTEKSKLES